VSLLLNETVAACVELLVRAELTLWEEFAFPFDVGFFLNNFVIFFMMLMVWPDYETLKLNQRFTD